MPCRNQEAIDAKDPYHARNPPLDPPSNAGVYDDSGNARCGGHAGHGCASARRHRAARRESAEGIAKGAGATFYAGDLFGGDIFRGNLQRGTAELFIDAPDGRMAVGMSADLRHGMLFVAGGFRGEAYVYDTRTGITVASYQLGDPASTFINDVTVTRNGARMSRVPWNFGGGPMIIRLRSRSDSGSWLLRLRRRHAGGGRLGVRVGGGGRSPGGTAWMPRPGRRRTSAAPSARRASV